MEITQPSFQQINKTDDGYVDDWIMIQKYGAS